MSKSTAKQPKNTGKGKKNGAATGNKPKSIKTKPDLQYDSTMYEDDQAWRKGEGIDLEPDESDLSAE